jgi:hypothetical protein
MNRKSVTVVVVVVLCAAGFAYSQGWFSRSSVSSDAESNPYTATVRVTEEKVASANTATE